MRRIAITGGAGFIGSAVVRYIIATTDDHVKVIDKLSYAGNLASLAEIIENPRFSFAKIDICDREAIEAVIADFRPHLIMHLAAESHVDRSIDGPLAFVETNIVGTYTMLEAARHYWGALPADEKEVFRFHHISTDEVFGDLETETDFFTESTPYAPSSPYSATKASSDHLVRAWHRTYGLPTIITNCSNNYGPYHFPEKLIPLMIINALAGKSLPVYGDGAQIRDWLYVDDHAEALYLVVTKGKTGETYNIGGHNERRNLDVVETLCDLLNELAPVKPKGITDFRQLITFVADRPGHDRRYAIDAGKIERELGWRPQETFETGMRRTVSWFLAHPQWWQAILDGCYQGERLGLAL